MTFAKDAKKPDTIQNNNKDKKSSQSKKQK